LVDAKLLTDYKKAARIQEKLASQIRLAWKGGPVRRVAGADISCRWGDDRAAAAIVVLSYPRLEVLETSAVQGRLPLPYVPGFLCFREGPLFRRAFGRIKTRPDVLLLDGNGIAHPRGLGLASYVGLLLAVPTIGCAKSAFFPFSMPAEERGAWTAYRNRLGKKVGYCLRTRGGVKPVFVSAGHLIDGSRSRAVVLACSGFRIPEPLRLAHDQARRALLKMIQGEE
jgi:deoxyribonuclease V